MAKELRVPAARRREDGSWWIPRLPPEWMRAIGPYETRAEADDARAGLSRTINSPAWRLMDDEDD